MPAPRGQMVSMHCFVDSDHAANTITRCSQTGLLLFVNRAPVMWFSKRQNTVETSTDRIPSTTPGAEPPRGATDSGSARSHSTHLESSSSDRP